MYIWAKLHLFVLVLYAMKCTINEMSYQWNVLSMKCSICEMSYLGDDTQTCCLLPAGQGIGCCPYRLVFSQEWNVCFVNGNNFIFKATNLNIINSESRFPKFPFALMELCPVLVLYNSFIFKLVCGWKGLYM